MGARRALGRGRDAAASAGIAAPTRSTGRGPPRMSGAIPASSCRRPAAIPFRRGCSGRSAWSGRRSTRSKAARGRSSSVIVARRGEGWTRRLRPPLRLQLRRQPLRLCRVRVAMREAGLDPDAEMGRDRQPSRLGSRRRREADIASIDAVCWALAKDHEAEAVAKPGCRAHAAAARPAVHHRARPPANEVAAIRAAIQDALADPARPPRRRAASCRMRDARRSRLRAARRFPVILD